jgi:signal transduction histidine kinase
MLRSFSALFAFVALFAVAMPLRAAEFGTRDEAITMVKRVQDMFKADGPDKTFAAVTSKQFNDRDLYPYVYQMTGVNVAHGANAALVGKDLIGLKDQNGNLLIREFVDVAKSGKAGWVDYKWPNPISNKIEDKSAYVDVMGDYAIGVGVYR